MEPGVHLARLLDYIHLNPVRARIVALEQLAQFRWSSYRAYVRGAAERPAWLECGESLRAHGELGDSPAGWRSYGEHLAWLMADEGRQKEAAFDGMSRGWALGTEEWQRALAKDFQKMEQAADWGGAEVAELNRVHWRVQLERGAAALGVSLLAWRPSRSRRRGRSRWRRGSSAGAARPTVGSATTCTWARPMP